MYLPLRHDAVEMEVCFEKVKQRTKEEKTNKLPQISIFQNMLAQESNSNV